MQSTARGLAAANQRDGLLETQEKSPNVGCGVCVIRGDKHVAKRLAGEFVGDLDECVPMTMPKARHAAVLAVAEAIVEDRDGTRWQASLNSRRED